MSFFFLVHNLHFSIEILGALSFLVVAWLAFDAFGLRRDFLTASRGIGFALLAVWQVFHAFQFPSDVANYVAYAIYILGIVFVLLNLLLESPVERPKFQAILLLPAFGALAQMLHGIASLGLLFIALLSFRQYKRELKKTLLPFWMGFSGLAAGSIAVSLSPPDAFGALWMLGHMFELAGFLLLGWWIWKYLELRIREEILLMFVSLTLLMAVVVSLTFSNILIVRMEAQTRESLLIDVRVLDFAISRLQQEAFSKTRIIAALPELAQSLKTNDFVALETILQDHIEKESLGFLSLLDGEGNVLLRAHALTQKGDNLAGEKETAQALKGDASVTVAQSEAEGFSIRAAASVVSDGQVIGVISGGFLLDNAFADSVKRITGLEMSVFQQDTLVATTMASEDRRSRLSGIRVLDPEVLASVLKKGEAATVRSTLASRLVLASYLPLRDRDGAIVGMISAAKPQHEVLKVVNATNRLTIAVVSVLMLILSLPIYFVTRRLSQEVH